MRAYLQDKGLELKILEDNPIFFTMFKQKLYKEFQRSFQGYCPLLKYVNIKNFHGQVRCIWEFLVNTPIDEDTMIG